MLGYLISPVLQVENTDGKPLVGGRIVVYRHGTTEPYITYKDFEGTHNPAEVILDSKGMCILIAEEGYSYDVYCRDRNYVEQWSRIGISIGLGGTSIISRDGTITVKSAGGVVDLGISDNDVTVLTGTGAERGTDGNFSISKTAESGGGLEVTGNRVKVKKAGWYHIEATWYAQSNTTSNGYRTVELETRGSRTKLTLDLTVSSEQWRIIANDFYLHADEYIDFTLSGMGSDSAVRSWLQNVSIHRLTNIVGNPPDRVRPDWAEQDPDSPAYIFNKPNLAPVATTGSYEDLTDKPDLDIYATKVENATDGNLAALDADGNLVDSGEAAANVVHDANYVHTDNNYTTADKNKLDGIEAGAEVNVQADWTEEDSSKDSYIQNKPHVPTVSGDGTSISSIDGLPIYAASATRATQDGAGNNIVDTYGTKAEVSAKQDQLTPGVNITISNTGVIDLRKGGTCDAAPGSVAIGYSTSASGVYALSHGESTYAGPQAHSEGLATSAMGSKSHSEGDRTIANRAFSHAEGTLTSAVGTYSHTEGANTSAPGYASHAEGYGTVATETGSHAEGSATSATGTVSHSEGRYTVAAGNFSHAEGSASSATGAYSHSEGEATVAAAQRSHAEGYQTSAIGTWSNARGYRSIARGQYSHAEGSLCSAFANNGSHAEGRYSYTEGDASHAEGNETSAIGYVSHAEGWSAIALGSFAHAEGYQTSAYGTNAHTEGNITVTSANHAHAEGGATSAVAVGAHSEGYHTVAGESYMHAEGQYNATSADAILVVGNGTSDANRSDALIVRTSGTEIPNNLTVKNVNIIENMETMAALPTVYSGSQQIVMTPVDRNNFSLTKNPALTGTDASFNYFNNKLYVNFSQWDGGNNTVARMNCSGSNKHVTIERFNIDTTRIFSMFRGSLIYIDEIKDWGHVSIDGGYNYCMFYYTNVGKLPPTWDGFEAWPTLNSRLFERATMTDIPTDYSNTRLPNSDTQYNFSNMFRQCYSLSGGAVEFMDWVLAEQVRNNKVYSKAGCFESCSAIPDYETLRTSETYSAFF